MRHHPSLCQAMCRWLESAPGHHYTLPYRHISSQKPIEINGLTMIPCTSRRMAVRCFAPKWG